MNTSSGGRWRALLAIGWIITAGACGGGSPGTSDSGIVPTPDAAADVGPDAWLLHPGTGTYEVTVRDATTWAGAPFAGAIVAFDYPGGGRREQMTDASGHTTFTDIDWSAGNASFVAWAPGYTAHAYVQVRQGDVTRCFLSPTARTTRALSGQVLHAASATHYLFVSASNATAQWTSQTETAYSLSLLDQGPALVVATEYGITFSGRSASVTGRAFAAVDVPAGTTPATVDVDLATTLPISTTHGHMTFPAGASSSITTSARAYQQVTTRESFTGLVLGAFRSTTIDAAGDGFDFVLDYVPLPAGRTDTVVTVYSFVTGNGGEGAQVIVPGYPVDGATIDTFLPSPVVPPLTASHAVHDAIVFEAPPAGADAFVTFFNDAGVIYVVSASNSDTVRLVPPRLPSTADEATVLAGPLSAQVGLCAPNATTFDCDRMTAAPTASLF